MKLVDKRAWVSSLTGLPNSLPQPPLACIVKAEADQNFSASGSSFNGGTIHGMACASPANVVDPKPAPGTFRVSFPDGEISELTNLQDIFGNQQLNQGDHDTIAYTSTGGDYPNGAPSQAPAHRHGPLTWWTAVTIPAMCVTADYTKLAFYDWLRRAPNNLSISSVVGILTTPFTPDPNAITPPTITWWCPTMVGGATQNLSLASARA